MNKCCLCAKEVEREDAPVLGMGRAGNPRVLCDDCEAHLDNAMRGKDYESIKNSVNILSDRLTKSDPDRYTFDLASALLLDASKRAKAIKDGTFDFSAEEAEDSEGYDEIPEELLESEEDKELDRIEEEKSKKFDKVYNIILIVLLALAAGYLVYTVIRNFFLQ